MYLNQQELYHALHIAIEKIETCGASPALTDAVIWVAEIKSAVGNKWNIPQEYAAERVKKELQRDRERKMLMGVN